MTLRAHRRAALCFALAVTLTSFVAFLVDATPQVVIDESEHERDPEVERFAVEESLPTLSAVLRPRELRREHAHAIREAKVLVTRNVTFRIDRPPPT
jgi:hypothetical protein